MNNRQRYDWIYFPTNRGGAWVMLSTFARGLGIELWLACERWHMRLYPGADLVEEALKWARVEGQERRQARRAIRELIKYELLVVDQSGLVSVKLAHETCSPRPVAREPISPSLRRQVVELGGNICGICQQPIEDSKVDIDHIHPVHQGGTNDISNLRVAHSSCNRARPRRRAESEVN